MKRITCFIASIFLLVPSMSAGSPNVQTRQTRANNPGVNNLDRGNAVSFDNDGEWYFFAGFKSATGCAEGFETITVFQYNTEKIIRVKPGVYSVLTRIITCAECSFNVRDRNFTDRDGEGQWFGVMYDNRDLGTNLENHVVACTEEVLEESFDGFLQRAICADMER